mgnify:CR=1 FL=1
MAQVSDKTAAALIQSRLRLPQLRLLLAVADVGQISGAAAQVGMTQPAASRLLAELERTAGTPLFDRHPRGVVLTQAGVLLARRARSALRDIAIAFDEVEMLASGTGGVVRIGTVTGPGLELVLPLIRDMRVTYPEIEFDVTVDTSDMLADALFAHRIDFYIGRVLANANPRDVTIRHIGPEPIALLVRKDHPLLRKADLTLKDTLAHDWVMQAPGGLLRRAVEAYLLRHDLPPPSRILSTSSLLLTLGIISDTNVVAPVARSVADVLVSANRLNGDVRVLDVARDMAVDPYGLVSLRQAAHAPAVVRILALLEERIRNRSPGPD